jgi:TonB family protein
MLHLVLQISTATLVLQLAAQDRHEPTSFPSAMTTYPPEAMRHGWEGDVSADLTINGQGRVSACRIVQSSGHAVLDEATCRLFRERARFNAAHNESGAPIESTFHVRSFKWRIAN